MRIKIPHIIKQKEIEKLFVVHPIEDIKVKEYSSNLTKDTLENLLKKISDDLAYLKKSTQEDDQEELCLLKWKFATMVIDRLFFLLTIFYLVISFLCIILTSQNFFKFK